jgi:Domain of unknown function (DUF6438)
MKTLLFFLASISMMATTKCHNKPNALPNDPSPLVQLQMHGCRGYCPTYKILFRNDGMLEYEGIRNMVKQGKDTVQLNGTELKQLREALASLNLWQYPERIESQVADASNATITVFGNEKEHSVHGSIDRPKPILEFENLLEDLAEAHGLKVKEGVNPYTAPANQQEILVKFKPEINPGNFLMQFEDIRLRIVRRVSAENLWIIGYNPDQITQKQLIDLLKGMEGVLEAKANN